MRRPLRNLAWFVIGMALFLAIGQLAYGQELKDLGIKIINTTPHTIVVRIQRSCPDDQEYPWHDVCGAEIEAGESFESEYRHPAGIFAIHLNIPAIDYSGTQLVRLGVPVEGATAVIRIKLPAVNQPMKREI